MRDTSHIKRGAFIKGGEVPNWFTPPDAVTKGGGCPTATALQKSPTPSIAEIGARIEGVTARLAELAKAIHAAKSQRQ